LPGYSHYCDFAANDAGKDCHDPSECETKDCRLERNKAKKYLDNIDDNVKSQIDGIACDGICYGKCTAYRVRHCDQVFDYPVREGKLYPVFLTTFCD